MKKFMIGMIVLLLICVGISWASESNDINIYKAEECFKKAENSWESVMSRNFKHNKGQSIYPRLIYQEEKKQTKLLEQIWDKMNGVER
jgi:uncharacterized protein YxeA